MRTKKIFLDGKVISARKELMDSLAPGVVQGKGAFETMRVSGGRIFVLERHLRRLLRGLKILKIAPPCSKGQWEPCLYKIIKANGYAQAKIRLAVWKDKQGVHTAIVCQEYLGDLSQRHQDGFNAVISEVRRKKTPHAHIKSMDYLCFRKAFMDARERGYDEAILLNNRGDVVEGSRTNVFFVKGKTLYTPAVRCGCLNGITRQIVIQSARLMNIPCKAISADAKKLFHAEEAFVTNSLLGVMPLTRVNDRMIGKGTIGPMTEKLQKTYCTKLHSSCPE